MVLPATGTDEVTVVEGGEGGHPVGLTVHRVTAVALLNLGHRVKRLPTFSAVHQGPQGSPPSTPAPNSFFRVPSLHLSDFVEVP